MHHTIELDWKVRLLTWLPTPEQACQRNDSSRSRANDSNPYFSCRSCDARSIATIAQDYKSRHSRATWRYWVEALLPDGAVGGRNSLFSWRWLD